MEAETILDSLENDLMKDAGALDEQNRRERSARDDGTEGASFKEANTKYQDRIQEREFKER